MQSFSVVVDGPKQRQLTVTAGSVGDAARQAATLLYGRTGIDAGVYRTSGQIGEPGAFRAYYRCRGCCRMAQRDSLRVGEVNGGN